MRRKTPSMEQFEKENPGKHAIWQGEITEQFRIWKELQLDPSYNPQFLYQGEDGFRIKRRENLTYYTNIIEEIIRRYGLSKTPNRDRIKHCGTLIYSYLNRSRFKIDWDEYTFHDDIKIIARDLQAIDKEKLISDNDFKGWCQEILKKINKAHRDRYHDVMSR